MDIESQTRALEILGRFTHVSAELTRWRDIWTLLCKPLLRSLLPHAVAAAWLMHVQTVPFGLHRTSERQALPTSLLALQSPPLHWRVERRRSSVDHFGKARRSALSFTFFRQRSFHLPPRNSTHRIFEQQHQHTQTRLSHCALVSYTQRSNCEYQFALSALAPTYPRQSRAASYC